MTSPVPQSSWKPRRSLSTSKLNFSIKDIQGLSLNASLNNLKRRSSKVELNKIVLKPRIKRKVLIMKDALLDDKIKNLANQVKESKKDEILPKKKFSLTNKPDNPSYNKVFMKPDFEVKESLFSHLEKTQKLGDYLKQFRKPYAEPSKLWTEKVSLIQKNLNTSVYNAGIISRMVLHAT